MTPSPRRLTHYPHDNAATVAWCGVPLTLEPWDWTFQRDRVTCHACRHIYKSENGPVKRRNPEP